MTELVGISVKEWTTQMWDLQKYVDTFDGIYDSRESIINSSEYQRLRDEISDDIIGILRPDPLGNWDIIYYNYPELNTL